MKSKTRRAKPNARNLKTLKFPRWRRFLPRWRTMTTYSCRAEICCDAIRVLHLLDEVILAEAEADAEADARFVLTKYDGETQGLEFRTTLNPNALLALFDCVRDTHVMEDTLRAVPLANNSLERGADLRGRT